MILTTVRSVEQEAGRTRESTRHLKLVGWKGKETRSRVVEDASWPGFAGIARMSVPLVTSFLYICPSPEAGQLHSTLGVPQVGITLFLGHLLEGEQKNLPPAVWPVTV